MRSKFKKIEEIISHFTKARIAVIGDVMLDTFTYGHVERMSPEAPVPIVLIDNEEQMLGGAGNVANNIASLGGTVSLYGRIGKDQEGKIITRLAEKKHIDIKGLLTDENGLSTIEKRRVLVDGIHTIRIDRETYKELTEQYTKELVFNLEKTIREFDALVICDYAKGFITENLAKSIGKLALVHNKPLVVDTKHGRHTWFSSATLLTPNEKEAYEMTGIKDPHEAGLALQKSTNTPVLVTRGPHGMTLIENDATFDYPVTETYVVDVSGAGDTVVATITLALAIKSDLPAAAEIANFAAGIAVSKAGTAEVSTGELIKKMRNATNTDEDKKNRRV